MGSQNYDFSRTSNLDALRVKLNETIYLGKPDVLERVGVEYTTEQAGWVFENGCLIFAGRLLLMPHS